MAAANGMDGAATQIKPQPSGNGRDPYTGVVIIHGLGDIRRNETLEEAINSLAYWFNHHAGLALRREGAGRVWVSARLTDDPNPDARTASATMEVVAPRTRGAAQDDPPLRLEFREVWWAGSFGLPSVGATIRWTRVQFSEQAANLLALFSSSRAGVYIPPDPSGGVASAGPDKGRPSDALSAGTRALLRVALRVYGALQYVWKAAQWLLLAPLVFLLLALMGPLQLLGYLPGVGPAIIAGVSAALNYIMLHWIAEAQVYALDYTRSASIRARFEREIETFLADERCDHIVVLAHSMGTVIAYEGLTNLLPKRGAAARDKQVTFICLAQALRRIWLMTADDPHRMRAILPDDVRWLHFWARYDPVTAGPLTRRSLPNLKPWPDPATPDPYEALTARLDACRNVAVVNTDSTFTDHSTYWRNLEQVVGPIARELVAGRPDLERLVDARRATADGALRRRWRVAWRATLSIVLGVGVALGVLAWGVAHPDFGDALTSFIGRINWGSVVGAVCPECTTIPIASLPSDPTIQQVEQFGLNNAGAAMLYLFTTYLTAQFFVVLALALALMGACMGLTQALVAEPSPFRFAASGSEGAPRIGALFGLASIGVALVFSASFLFSSYAREGLKGAALPDSNIATTYIWALGVAEMVFWISYIVTLIGVIQRRQWGWLAGVTLGVLVVGVSDPIYKSALLAIAIAGCALFAYDAVRARAWIRALILPLVAALAAYAGIGTTLYQFDIVRSPLLGAGVGVEYLLPMLIYALWLDTAPATRRRHIYTTRRAALALAALYIIPVALLALPLIIQRQARFSGPLTLANLLQPATDHALSLTGVAVALALLLGVAVLALAIADAVRSGRYGWIGGLAALLLATFGGLDALLRLGAESSFQEWGVALSFAIIAPALIYILWGGASARRSDRNPAPTKE